MVISLCHTLTRWKVGVFERWKSGRRRLSRSVFHTYWNSTQLLLQNLAYFYHLFLFTGQAKLYIIASNVFFLYHNSQEKQCACCYNVYTAKTYLLACCLTGQNNVFLPALFRVVNNMEQYCWTWVECDNAEHYCWQLWAMCAVYIVQSRSQQYCNCQQVVRFLV